MSLKNQLKIQQLLRLMEDYKPCGCQEPKPQPKPCGCGCEQNSNEEAMTRFWVKVGAIFTILILLYQIGNKNNN